MTTIAAIDLLTILAFLGTAAWSVISDMRRRLIPNTASLVIALLFVLHVAVSPQPVEWMGAGLVALGAFAVGVLLFASRVMGGGDVKLFAAVALWAGPALGIHYLVVTVVAGALLSVFTLMGLRFARSRRLATVGGNADQILQDRATVAYGAAIGVGAGFIAAVHVLSLIG